MKKTKILVISAFLTFIFSSCASNNTVSNTFPYTTPDGSFNNSFVVDVSLKPNDLIKKQIDLLNEGALNYDDLNNVFNNFVSNDLCINKTTATYIKFDKYDYGKNDTDETTNYDVGNFEFAHTAEIFRDNNKFSKHGSLKLKGFEIVENKSKEAELKTFNIDDGVYDANIDFENFKIQETFDYKDESLNKTNEYYLSENNFLMFLNMTENSQFINNFKKAYNEKDEAGSYNFEAKKEGNTLTVNFILNYQIDTASPNTKISFGFIIKDGVITNTSYLYEVCALDKTLEKEYIAFQYFIE